MNLLSFFNRKHHSKAKQLGSALRRKEVVIDHLQKTQLSELEHLSSLLDEATERLEMCFDDVQAAYKSGKIHADLHALLTRHVQDLIALHLSFCVNVNNSKRRVHASAFQVSDPVDLRGKIRESIITFYRELPKFQQGLRETIAQA